MIRTVAGNLPSEVLADGRVAVDMGPARCGWEDVPLARADGHAASRLSRKDRSAIPAAVSMGNPHATFFVPDAAAVPIAQIGPRLERAALFPERANIGFAQVLSPEQMRLRVWERGAGLTLACGSGACAAVVNAARRGLTSRNVAVQVDGGTLDIAWLENGHVLMTGPVATAFRGVIDLASYPS